MEREKEREKALTMLQSKQPVTILNYSILLCPLLGSVRRT